MASGEFDSTSRSSDPIRFFKVGLFLLVFVTLFSTIVFWSLGFYYQEPDWTLLNCLFFVVLTLSTVGYGDSLGVVNLLAPQLLSLFLMFAGVVVHGFFISNVTALIVQGLLHNEFRRRRMNKSIEKLNDHIIVCGIGALGSHCVNELIQTGRPFVVIDRNEQHLQKMNEKLGSFLYIVDEADNDDVLQRAGIQKATGLLACLTDDKDNLFVTLSARRMNSSLRIISKAVADNAHDKLISAGADRIVNPSAIGGLRLVSELIRPTVVSFIDTMMRDPHQKYRFEELTVEPGCSVQGKSLAEADLRRFGDILVVAARKSGAPSFTYNPKADFKLDQGCMLVVLGENNDLKPMRPFFSKG